MLQGSVTKMNGNSPGFTDDSLDRNKDDGDSNDCLYDRKTALDNQVCVSTDFYKKNTYCNLTFCWRKMAIPYSMSLNVRPTDGSKECSAIRTLAIVGVYLKTRENQFRVHRSKESYRIAIHYPYQTDQWKVCFSYWNFYQIIINFIIISMLFDSGCSEQVKAEFLKDLMETLKNQMAATTNGTEIVGYLSSCICYIWEWNNFWNYVDCTVYFKSNFCNCY